MSPRMSWETQENLDLIIAYGADPDVLLEFDFEPVRIRMIRNVLRLKGYNGDRMFKKVANPDTRLPFVYGVVEHIYRNGFHKVPRFILNKYGDPYVLDENGQYYMTDWFMGREIEIRKPRHLELIAANLGTLHQAAVGYQHTELIFDTRDDVRSAWRKALAKLQSYHQMLLHKGDRTEFDRIVLENYEFVTEMIEDALYQLKNSPYTEVVARAREQHQVCHGSVSRQNILLDDDQLIFIDFDHCHYGPVVQDLASFLHRYMPRSEWDEDVVLGILEAYQQNRPLTKDELHVLNVYLQFPVRTVQLMEWYYEKLRDWDEKTYEEALLKSLDREEDRDDWIDIMADYYGIDLFQEDGQQSAVSNAVAGPPNPYVPVHADYAVDPNIQDRNQNAVENVLHSAQEEYAQQPEVPVQWTAESSSFGLIDDEVEPDDHGGNRSKVNRKRRSNRKSRESKQSNVRQQQARPNGVWLGSPHIGRPAPNETD